VIHLHKVTPMQERREFEEKLAVEPFRTWATPRIVGAGLVMLGLILIASALSACVSDSIKYDPTNHIIEAHRFAIFTNIGGLHADASKNADGSLKATVDETNIDQTTAAALALQAAAQLALKAAAP
jgi:hypothetical protein